MWLTKTAIGRPIFILMFVVALIFMGVQQKAKMPKEQIPNIDVPLRDYHHDPTAVRGRVR